MTTTANIEEVLSEYSGLLARIAASYESDKQLQEDLLQDISLAVWKALEKFDNKASLKTYIARIAHNRSVDHVIKHSKRNEQDFHNQNGDDHINTMGEQSDLANESINHEKSLDLMSALHRLSINYRQVITMQLEGFTLNEIAKVLGIQEDAVAKRASRARKQLTMVMKNND